MRAKKGRAAGSDVCQKVGMHAGRQAGSERKAGRQRVVCNLRALFGNLGVSE